MKASQACGRALIAMAVLLSAATGVSCAQGTVTATVAQSGLIEVGDGSGVLAVVDLNAHGPGWQNAPQDSATGQVTDVDGATRVTGTLPVPNTEGGALNFTETITALPQGLRIEYDVSVAQAMRLSGLQLSVNLPVSRYAGGEVMITRPHDDPDIAGLPEEQTEGRTQLWRGDGATVEVASDTPEAISVQLRAATDVVIQDLRQWEHEVFEIRLPAIMEDPGREVSADDRFHLDVTITFAGPLTLQSE
ncbi:MAG: hypothetical protein ACOCX2_00095 [Armatimonadota bacterium]